MNDDRKLRKISNQVILYQISSIIMLVSASIFTQFISIEIFALLLFMIFTPYSFYIVFVLIFQENSCPNCTKPFFKKEGSFSNLGFSFYTKKCTNCGYKLKD